MTSDEIDENGEQYYQFYIKEGMQSKLITFCTRCDSEKHNCDSCEITKCNEKLTAMSLKQFKKFTHITNPTVDGKLDIHTYSEYLKDGINNPFAAGLRDIPRKFLDEKDVVLYVDDSKAYCVLTTLCKGGFDDDEADRIIAAGGKSVSLGKTILRTETAGMAAVAMIMYELEL
jgi:hypothetical protein